MTEGSAAGNIGAISRRTILVGGAGAAAVVVVVVLLLVSGVLPGFRPSGPGGTLSPGIPRYAVDFTESGLPSGTNWSVTLAGLTTTSDSAQVGFLEANGTYAYHITPPSGFNATPSSGNVTVNGRADLTSVQFASPPTYAVNFTESGLATATNWTVTFNGTSRSSTAPSISFESGNGSFPFVVPNVAGYSAHPPSGSVTVVGAEVNVSIAFTPLPVTKYTITFSESGLPSGSYWSVSLNGTANSTTGRFVTFSEPNGSFPFRVGAVSGFSTSSQSGTVIVGGSAVSKAIAFTPRASPPTAFNVTYNETGLAVGTLWDISFDSNASNCYCSASDEGNPLILSLPNGTYVWFASSQSALHPSPGSGTVVVAGASQWINVSFVPPPPPTTNVSVEFQEQGLYPGTNWSVNFNGTPLFSTNTTINARASSGSYFYVAWAVGYETVNAFFTVKAAPVLVQVPFSRTFPIFFNETGLTVNDSWWVSVNGSAYTGVAGSPIEINVTNGTYVYQASAFGGYNSGRRYTATPSMGNITVMGTPSAVSFRFSRVSSYTVTFAESGLPSGAVWEVWLGLSYSYLTGPEGPAGSLAFGLSNGTYVWAATELYPNTSYIASPLAGSVTVDGANVIVPVSFTFAPGMHEVLMVENDVLFSPLDQPSAMSWGVTVDAHTYLAAGGFVLFAVPNGSFTFSVDSPAGYLAVPSGGTLVVNDPGPFALLPFPYINNLTVVVGFIPAPALIPDVSVGLQNGPLPSRAAAMAWGVEGFGEPSPRLARFVTDP